MLVIIVRWKMWIKRTVSWESNWGALYRRSRPNSAMRCPSSLIFFVCGGMGGLFITSGHLTGATVAILASDGGWSRRGVVSGCAALRVWHEVIDNDWLVSSEAAHVLSDCSNRRTQRPEFCHRGLDLHDYDQHFTWGHVYDFTYNTLSLSCMVILLHHKLWTFSIVLKKRKRKERKRGNVLRLK